jgi:hypothetical protein
MNDERKLTDAFRALDEAEREDGVSAEVEARLRAQVRGLAAARRQRRIHFELARVAAVLIAVVGVFVIARGPRIQRPVQVERHPAPAATVGTVGTGGAVNTVNASRAVATAAAGEAREETTPFLPLTYGTVPVVDAQIVRLEVPRAAMVAFGYAAPEMISGSTTRETVLADVLVGEDGLARAVRFVSASSSHTTQEKSR